MNIFNNKDAKGFNDVKDLIQYAVAVIAILSGIVLCFCSFFLLHDVIAGALGYLGIVLTFGGSVFGISAYVRTSVAEAKFDVEKELDRRIDARMDIRERRLLKPSFNGNEIDGESPDLP